VTPKYLRPAAVLAVAVFVAACSGGGDSATPVSSLPATSAATTTVTTTPPTQPPSTPPPTLPPPSTVTPVETTLVPDILRMPLTGQPITDVSEIPNRPAMAVKIENSPAARPQQGLNQADIVFEEIINGGITRFAAVFHSQGSDPVGPIRSGRYPDIHLLEAFDHPLYVWSGGNGGVTYYITRSQLTDLSFLHTSGYYRRTGLGRKKEHTLYTSTEAMWEKTPADFHVPPAVLQYVRPGEVLNGDAAATQIDVTMDGIDVHWEYDPDTGRYLRSQEGGKHMMEDGEQVSTENVVVMMANYLQSPIDAETPDAQTLGVNPVYIFTGGTVRTGIWLRWASTDRYAFYDNLDDLNELRLQPGRTFIELPRNIDGSITWS
jgi:hypothetical protein